MRKTLFFLPFLIAVLAGCNSDPSQQLVGAWKVDLAKTTLPKITMPGDEAKIKTDLAALTLKLNNDKTYTGSDGNGQDVGTWALKDNIVNLQPNPQGSKMAQARSLDLSPNKQDLTLVQNSPIGEAKVVFTKTG